MELSEGAHDTGSHLSIGEVLSQLHEEFPDVTISKIRFLEAQGLIDPERTPSGYRKFYDGDISRLIWILRQQRDHFLPLKVIKAKLDQGDGIDFESTAAAQPNLWSGDPDVGADGAPVPSTTVDPPWKPAVGVGAAPPTHPAPARQDSAVPAPAEPTSNPTPTPTRATSGHPSASGQNDPPATPVTTPASAASISASPEPDPRAAERQAAAETAERDAAAWLAALQESPGSTPAPRTESGPAAPAGRGVRFGLDEVVEVTSISPEDMESLIDYGLVAPIMVGGERTFDASSVAVVRAVAPFLARGLESRHLRSFKNAAERQAGFFEQMILPLLKQRNLEARERATADLAVLAEAGDALNHALVRQALRTHLGE